MHLVDLPAFYPPHRGGVESYAFELHRRLLDAEPELRITVLTSHGGADSEVEQLSARWTVVRWPAFEPVSQYPLPAPRLRRLLRRYCGPDSVVMTHTRFYLHALLAGGFARSRDLGWVHVEHGTSPVRSGGPIMRTAANLVDRTAGRRVLRRADSVIGVSHAASAFVAELSGREAAVLHRGIEVPDRPAVRGPEPVLCYVGRLIDSKGLSDLLHALCRLLDEGRDVRLRLCGDGPARTDLERRVVAFGLSGHVEFLGAVSQRTAQREMASSTVVVNPSWTEGLPTTVLEAAALGAAVVATDVGGTSEIVTPGSTGRLVPPHHPAELARSVAEFLDDAELRVSTGEALRADTARRFRWERTVDGFRSILGRVSGGAASSGGVPGIRQGVTPHG